MRSISIFIAGAALVLTTGSTVYFLTSERSSHGEPPTGGVMPTAPWGNAGPARNPLLTANLGQFDRWVPSYPINCGKILLEKDASNPRYHSLCVREIRSRVSAYTLQEITRDDVLNPDVWARWHKVMVDAR